MDTNFIEYNRNSIDNNINIRNQLTSSAKIFTWKVRFSDELDPSTVNSNNLFVTTQSDRELLTNITYNKKENIIEIRPIYEYQPDTTYILTITKKVKSITGVPLAKELKLEFKIKS